MNVEIPPAVMRFTRDMDGRRRHDFLQSDGRWQGCGGPGYCRECSKPAARKPSGENRHG